MQYRQASWNLHGKWVTGMYLEEHEFEGVVTHSRVKYGGKVQHTVLLDEPIEVYGSLREILLMDDDEIVVLG